MRCLHPISLLDPASGYPYSASCGRCRTCRINKQEQWIFRNEMELRLNPEASFVTLTYRPEDCPESLDYSDIQSFLKRFRKSVAPKPIRFYCTGEYGSKTQRPHWHLLIYGHQFPKLGHYPIEQWPSGFAYIGQVTSASIRYTVGYLMKDGSHAVTRSSRKPGIGLDGLRILGARFHEYGYQLEYSTPALQIGKRYIPLSETMRQALLDGFIQSGGLVKPKKSLIQRGLEKFENHMIHVIAGDPIYNMCRNEAALRKLALRERKLLDVETL